MYNRNRTPIRCNPPGYQPKRFASPKTGNAESDSGRRLHYPNPDPASGWLLASQLPDFQFKEQAHFHIYPDQPHTNNQATENGMQSQKVEKLAIVPTEPGDIVLPELTLHWWNTEQNTLETITLPSKTLTVLPALTSQNNTFDTAPLPETPETVSRETSTADSTTWSVSWFSALLLGLWLITLWYALKWRRALQNLPSEPTETANLKNDQAWSKSPEMDTVCDEAELDAKSLYRAVWPGSNKPPWKAAIVC